MDIFQEMHQMHENMRRDMESFRRRFFNDDFPTFRALTHDEDADEPMSPDRKPAKRKGKQKKQNQVAKREPVGFFDGFEKTWSKMQEEFEQMEKQLGSHSLEMQKHLSENGLENMIEGDKKPKSKF